MLFMKFGVTLFHLWEKSFKSPLNLSWYNLLYLVAILLDNFLLWLLQFLDVVKTKPKKAKNF